MSDTPKHMSLSELAAELQAAEQLPPLDRYRSLSKLGPVAAKTISVEKDRAVAEAVAEAEPDRYSNVAAELGVARSNINNRVLAHRRRTGSRKKEGAQE